MNIEDSSIQELKPNRCRCKGKAIVKQDKKTGKYYVICRDCLTRSATFESRNNAVDAWNNSAGRKASSQTTKAIYNANNRKYQCENCKSFVNKNDKYCHECGMFIESKRR